MTETPNRFSVLKLMELLLAIGCTVLHYYSFDDRDFCTAFVGTGTFCGFIGILLAIFAGFLMRSPIGKRIDIVFSCIGAASFIASGYCIIQAWESALRTQTRDLAILKGSLSIITGAVFILDALFTFRDK